MLLIFIIPFIQAETSYVFKKDSNVDLKISCFDEDKNFCSATTPCQVTINYPNQTNLLKNADLTYNTNYYNITLNSTQTAITGEYSVIVTCQGNSSGFATFTYEVNPTGIRASEQRTDALTRSIYFLFGIAIVLFAIFIFVDLSLPIKWTFFILAFIFLLIGVNVVFVSLKDEVVNPSLENLFSFLTTASFILYWFAGVLLLFIWMLTIMNTYILKKNQSNIRRFGGE